MFSLETGFAQIAQALLWPVLTLVGLGFIYALWAAGAVLMEAVQRWRSPAFQGLRFEAHTPIEQVELQVVRQLEPLRLLGPVLVEIQLLEQVPEPFPGPGNG